MEFPWYLYALILGIGSSLHCLGMCGPLVMALPIGNEQGYRPAVRFVSYAMSKAFMYGLMGLAPGLIGWSIKEIIGPWWISLLAGVLVLLVATLPSLKTTRFFPSNLMGFIKDRYLVMYNKPRWYYFVMAGVFNAFLPCTMIWIAMTASIAIATPIIAFWFMFFFGVGTVPALGLAQFGKSWYFHRFRSQAHKASRIITFLLAIVLLLRGLWLSHGHSLNHGTEVISSCKLLDL